MERRRFLISSAAGLGTFPMSHAFATQKQQSFDFSQVDADSVNLNIQKSPSRPSDFSLQAHTYDDQNNLHSKELLFAGDTIYSQDASQSWIFHPTKHLFLNFDAIPQSTVGHIIFAKRDSADHSFAVGKYMQGQVSLVGVVTPNDIQVFFENENPDNSDFIYHSSFESTGAEDDFSFAVSNGYQLCFFTMDDLGNLSPMFQVNGDTTLDSENDFLFSPEYVVTGPHYNLTGEHKNTYFFHHETNGLTLCHVGRDGLEFVTTFLAGDDAPAVLTNPQETWSWHYQHYDHFRYCLQDIGRQRRSVLAFQTPQGLVHFTLAKDAENNIYTPRFVHVLGFGDDIHKRWTYRGSDTAEAVTGHSVGDSHDYILFTSGSHGWALYHFDELGIENSELSFTKVMGRIVDEPTLKNEKHCFSLCDELSQKKTNTATAKKRTQYRNKLFSNQNLLAINCPQKRQDAGNKIYLSLHHFQKNSGRYFVVDMAIPTATSQQLFFSAGRQTEESQNELRVTCVRENTSDNDFLNDYIKIFEDSCKNKGHGPDAEYAAGFDCGFHVIIKAAAVCGTMSKDEIRDHDLANINDFESYLMSIQHVNSAFLKGFEAGKNAAIPYARNNITHGERLFELAIPAIIASALLSMSFLNEIGFKPADHPKYVLGLLASVLLLGSSIVMICAAQALLDQKPW